MRGVLLVATALLLATLPATRGHAACVAHGSAECAAGTGTLGASSSTDNAVVRWDGTSGTRIQNSGCTVSDTGVVSCPDQNPAAANALEVRDNAGYGATCATDCPAGSWCLIDTDTTANTYALKVCHGNTDLNGFRLPNIGDARIEPNQTLVGAGSGTAVWSYPGYDIVLTETAATTETDDTTNEQTLSTVTLTGRVAPVAGTVYTAKTGGAMTLDAGATATMRFNVGGTLACSVVVDPTEVNSRTWFMDVAVTVRTAGSTATAKCNGILTISDSAAPIAYPINTAEATIDLDGTPAVVLATSVTFNESDGGSTVVEETAVFGVGL